jgi:hypothetical protein
LSKNVSKRHDLLLGLHKAGGGTERFADTAGL